MQSCGAADAVRGLQEPVRRNHADQRVRACSPDARSMATTRGVHLLRAAHGLRRQRVGTYCVLNSGMPTTVTSVTVNEGTAKSRTESLGALSRSGERCSPGDSATSRERLSHRVKTRRKHSKQAVTSQNPNFCTYVGAMEVRLGGLVLHGGLSGFALRPNTWDGWLQGLPSHRGAAPVCLLSELTKELATQRTLPSSAKV